MEKISYYKQNVLYNNVLHPLGLKLHRRPGIILLCSYFLYWHTPLLIHFPLGKSKEALVYTRALCSGSQPGAAMYIHIIAANSDCLFITSRMFTLYDDLQMKGRRLHGKSAVNSGRYSFYKNSNFSQ